MSSARILTQEYLFEKLQVLFPHNKIHLNARKDHNFKYESTHSFLELDCWIPEHNLGFEFQDHYHYVSTWYSQRPHHNVKQRDDAKKTLVMNNGITLVSVPVWWDGNHESLGASIQFESPEIEFDLENTDPISLNPPLGYFEGETIPGVGELMLASFPPENKVQEFDWWMGEKYDGVRLCWNGAKQTVYTRTGITLFLPADFKRCLPKVFLDGEFWFGRGQFHVACMVVNSAPEFIHWHELRMVVFDNPFRAFYGKPFEERYELLLSHISSEHPFVIVASRMKCKHKYHLNKFAKEIIDNGGEGVILREPESSYQSGRSQSLIKLKSALCDTEAMVVAVVQKSVKLGLPNGITFLVPPENVQIPTPQIGQVVTFSFERRTHVDTPINPCIIKVREDLLWKDVVLNAHKERKYLNEHSNVLPLDMRATERMRLYMENFAKNQNTNPLLPETWYLLSYSAIQQFQSGKLVLQKFQGSYFKTMRHLFPEIQFDKNSFPEIEKRRDFFIEYARSCSFAYRDPENWYKQRRKHIMSFEGAQQIISFHGGSVAKALIELFPDINFDRSKFPKPPIWRKSRNRRQFFEEYAKESNFDPLVPDNWYMQPRKKIHSRKGADRVLSYHNHSVVTALLDLFPEIGLDKSRFSRLHQYGDANNRRYFFERYAKANSFDHLNPNAWYSQSRKNIESFPGAKRVLFYHNYNVAKALLDLFPEIGLENSKFLRPYSGGNINTTKKFLENFAQTNAFDPQNAENWYLHFKILIQAKQSTGTVFHTDIDSSSSTRPPEETLRMNLYDNLSVAKALLEIYPNIGLEKSKFPKPGLWYNKANTRKYFEDYAKENNFDPQEIKNWYSHYKTIVSLKSSTGIVFYQNQNVQQALLTFYPELDKAKFSASNWKNQQETKQFFDTFANVNGFDPHNPQNWNEYLVELAELKKSTGIIFYNNISIPKALSEIYTNLKLKNSHVPPMWFSQSHRKKFFENYAQENGFDALNPEDWYIQSLQKIMAKKGIRRVLHYHNDSLAQALVDLLPDIGLDMSKLPKPPLWMRVKKNTIRELINFKQAINNV